MNVGRKNNTSKYFLHLSLFSGNPNTVYGRLSTRKVWVANGPNELKCFYCLPEKSSFRYDQNSANCFLLPGIQSKNAR